MRKSRTVDFDLDGVGALVIGKMLSAKRQRIACLVVFDLVLWHVGARVVHVVTGLAVGLGLDQDRTFTGEQTPPRVDGALVYLQNVIAVYGEALDAITLTAAEQVDDTTRLVHGSGHGELVVLDDEQQRQVPDGGQVQRLAEGPVVGGAVGAGGLGISSAVTSAQESIERGGGGLLIVGGLAVAVIIIMFMVFKGRK